ncbi:MAG TPA: sigma-70 family RNA polymerase sigma factor [Phycisphaerae bacterium]|nr:sigma-70 family RNA polymerase sigma factor [Phycisphaerae bacterium]
MSADLRILQSALLVTRHQRGDAAAFTELVHLWQKPLFYYLRRLAASEPDAWELLQESWLKLFRSLKTLRDPHAFPAFLYTIARTTALSRLRSPELTAPDSLPPADAPDFGEDPALAFDNADQVHHALEQLPLPQREVLTLFFLHDLSLEQIATLLTVPLGTVKSRLHYARQALKTILTPSLT